MSRLYHGLKDALENSDFVLFNELLDKKSKARKTAHLENNYALKEAIFQGSMSSVQALLKIDAVWVSYNTDEVVNLAAENSHEGIKRLVNSNAVARFKHLLANATSADQISAVSQMYGNSEFLAAHAHLDNNESLKLAIKKGALSLVKDLLKNNEAYNNCGLNELYLALKHSNHKGIVRELLKNKAYDKLLGDEKAFIMGALEKEDFDFAGFLGTLESVKGITDQSAMSKSAAKEVAIQATAGDAVSAKVLVKNSLFTPANAVSKQPAAVTNAATNVM